MSDEIYEDLVKDAKDITAEIEIKPQNANVTVNNQNVEAPAPQEGSGEVETKPESDHALTGFIEMGINYTDEHARNLRSRGFEVPEVNKPLWEKFAKPFLNRAFWHYLPESDGLEDPRLALLAGGALTAMAVAPSLVGIINYYRAENERQKKKAKDANAVTQKQIQREVIKEVAKEAEEEKQKQIEQAIQESPYLKRVKYEKFAGL